MSAPIQPPRPMAVHLVGFLGLPWRIWSYLTSTLFFWGLVVLVLVPVGLLGKVALILVPFLGAVGLAWPRGGRHLDEWAALAWRYDRAKRRAQRQRARRRVPSARHAPQEQPGASWETSLLLVEDCGWEETGRDGEAPLRDDELAGEEPALEDEGDLERLPSAGVLSRRQALETAGRLPRRASPVDRNHTPSTELIWDEESGTFYDAPGAFLLDVGRSPGVPPFSRQQSRRGRIIPMPRLPRQRAVGHDS